MLSHMSHLPSYTISRIRSETRGKMERNEIEIKVVKAFIVTDRKEKYLEALPNSKRRAKILDRLNHHIDDIDSQYRISVPPDNNTPSVIEKLLRSRGAPSQCYVMSSSNRLDGREMPLADALRDVIGYQMGTLISCIPGQLAFYESEEIKIRYILERKA